MNRRNFLKSLGAIAVAAIPFKVKSEPDIKLPFVVDNYSRTYRGVHRDMVMITHPAQEYSYRALGYHIERNRIVERPQNVQMTLF